MSENRFRKGDWTNCRYDICEIIDEDDEVVCIVSLNDADKIIKLLEENELLKAKADTLTKWAKNLEKRLRLANDDNATLKLKINGLGDDY